MTERNRSEGWRYAKLTGHENEQLVKDALDSDAAFQRSFMSRIQYEGDTISSTSIGGLHEKDVPGVLRRKTKSKTDLKLYCTSGRTINVSIKKSYAGQVYFVDVDSFIDVYEQQFRNEIPLDVQYAMRLFWAGAKEDALRIINQYCSVDDDNYTLQVRHQSLNATTMKMYDDDLYHALLDWFVEHAYNIAHLAFMSGAVLSRDEWAEYVWYINLIDSIDLDELFHAEILCKASEKYADQMTYFSTTNGGTTIQLPFGFVQWHQGKMQFHHKYEKIRYIYQNYLNEG